MVPAIMEKMFVEKFFHILAHFPFSKSERQLDYYDQKVNTRVALQFAERLKAHKIKAFQEYFRNAWN